MPKCITVYLSNVEIFLFSIATGLQVFSVEKDSQYCPGLVVGYIPLMRCEAETANRIDGFNFAVINCGHHPASKLHYSYTKYHRVVRELLDGVHSRGKEMKSKDKHWPVVMWLDITAQPLRQDRYVISKADWRTYHRLLLFRAIAWKELHGTSDGSKYPNELKMETIPAFSSTLAVFDKMCDNAHYPTDAKMPQVCSFHITFFASSRLVCPYSYVCSLSYCLRVAELFDLRTESN